jgi:uncharacterized protein YidB (DUF937 family)
MGAVSSGSEGGMPTWFHNERANTIPDSKGDKKLRVDLFEMLNIEVQKSTTDVANQFLIAAATDEVIEDSDDKKTAKLPGRVAVKISQEGEGDLRVYKYAFLNLNSLAKRLHVSTEEIKQEEKAGTLGNYIKDKVAGLSARQNKLTEILLAAAENREATFGAPAKALEEPAAEGRPEQPAAEGRPEEPAVEGRLEPITEEEELSPEQKNQAQNREFLKDFIEEHFPDDEYLNSNLELFLNNSAESPDVSRDYSQTLVKKLWWDTGKLGSELKVAPGKIALTNVTNLKDLGLSTFVGKAASRPGNAGSESTTRLSMVEGDKTGRYAIAIDDFLYSEKPEPRSRNEVALQLSNHAWVLANKNSLKRLGLSNAQISDTDTDTKSLGQAVEEKRNAIGDFSISIVEIANKWTQAEAEGERARISEDDMEIIRNLKNHPDEMVQEMTKDFLKTFDTWRKKQLKKITEDVFAEKAVGRVGKLIQDLEDAGLILHPRAKIRSFADRNKDTEVSLTNISKRLEEISIIAKKDGIDISTLKEALRMPLQEIKDDLEGLEIEIKDDLESLEIKGNLDDDSSRVDDESSDSDEVFDEK